MRQFAAGDTPCAVTRTKEAGKPGRENSEFSVEKLKTGFQCVNSTWEQIKNISEII